MDALIASYGETDSESELESPALLPSAEPQIVETENNFRLPPPPLSLLNPPNSLGGLEELLVSQPSKVRNFPHVDGNYALHVYIPVYIPTAQKKEVALFLKKITSLEPGLHLVDLDIPLDILCKEDQKLEQIALGREFHISLGRTVPIRVHQIDSLVSMLKQKIQFQRRYWIDFSKWEIFVNDDKTRTFLSLEVVTEGLHEISRQICAVNEVYRLHNLPEFYKDPRPHISLAWVLGDVSASLKGSVEETLIKSAPVGGTTQKCIFATKCSGIECKIGQKTYKIRKFPHE